MLAYIHPFVDGNGRTARSLFYWYMLRHGYYLMEYLSISRVIYRSKKVTRNRSSKQKPTGWICPTLSCTTWNQ